jgi:hypothetical protein
VILRMSWMKAHKALLDTAARVVPLDSLMHDIDVLHLLQLHPFTILQLRT